MATKMIVLDGRAMPYDRVRLFDGRVLDLGFENPAYPGGYFTAFPLSPLSYRREHPTKAAVHVSRADDATTFTITTDWGGHHTLVLPARFKAAIDAAIAAATAEELLKEPADADR